MEKIYKQKVIYQNDFASINDDDVILENGVITNRLVVHHPGAAAILALHKEKVILVRQYRYACQEDLWEVPAGKLVHTEMPIQCAIRELNEETGYAGETLIPLGFFYPAPGFSSEKIWCFRADECTKVDKKLAHDFDESIIVKLFSKTEIIKMIANNEITDLKTIYLLTSWIYQ